MEGRSATYKETREKIKELLEGDRLRRSLKEFFQKQAAFHANMKQLLQMYRGVMTTLQTREERQVLEEILAPYQVLLSNPLREEASGDIEMDIAHIESVMNARNEQFKTTLEALALTASRHAKFHQIIDKLKLDPVLKEVMLATIKSNNWMDVQGMIDMPFQNLMRYELLLRSIGQVLEDSGLESAAPALTKIMDVLAYIMPELAYINEHHDVLVKLGRIDDLVVRVGKIKSLPVFVTEEDEKFQLTTANKIQVVRYYIINTRNDIVRGNANILLIYTGLSQILKALADGLDVGLQKDEYSYSSLAYYGLANVVDSVYGRNSLFPMPEKDPRAELVEVIAEMDEACKIIDIVQETERRLLQSKR